MKFLLILFILSFNICQSQNITLDNLISLRSKNLSEVEEVLSLKNWNFLEVRDYPNLKNVIFSYNKNEATNYATSFLTYMYSEIDTDNRIYLQINNKNSYNEFITKLKSYNCKLIKSSSENGYVTKIYQGKTITFIIKVMMSNDDNMTQNNLYTFYLMTNSDYTTKYLYE